MDRRIRVALIVVVVVTLAYPAAAWLLGLMVEHEWERREQLALERVPYITVIKRDYRRGVYSSSEELTYGVQKSVLTRLAGISAANPVDALPMQLVVRNTIHHGPLPELRSFAPATVDTRLVLPPEIQQKLTLIIHTRMKWIGGSTTFIHGDAMQWTTAAGSVFDWRGVDAKLDLGRELGAQAIELTSPGLAVKGAQGTANIGTLKANFDVHPVFEILSTGGGKVTVDRIDIEGPAQSFKAAARNLVINANTTVDGDYVTTGATFDLDSLEVGKFTATKAGYEYRVAHLHGPSLAAFSRALRETTLAANATPANAATAPATPADPAAPPPPVNPAAAPTPADPMARLVDAFRTSGAAILAHDPVLKIPRMGFTTPDGALLISVTATLPGVTQEELNGPSEALRSTILKHAQTSLDARIDTALLDKLLDSTGKGDTITAQLQGLQRQGYIKLEGKALTTHLAFQDGRLKVNDLPFPPMPAGGPGMQGPPGGPAAPDGPRMPGGPHTPNRPAMPNRPAAPH